MDKAREARMDMTPDKREHSLNIIVLQDLIREQKAEIDRLLTALENIAKRPRGGLIDTPEKMERDEMIGIARAALAQEKSND
jgi:hypothetical protein